MKYKESVMHRKRRSHGGIRLEHFKNTADSETVIMPAPDRVCIPMLQNIGVPANPIVKPGDTVFVGTRIGEPNGKMSVPVHSSVSGTVKEISECDFGGRIITCVIIDSDGKSQPDPDLMPRTIASKDDLVNAARDCGLVGLGGAGFPANVKLDIPDDTYIDTLVINAAECEPYITSDYRECIENYNDIVEGVYLIKETLGIKNVVICVENNKPKAIEKLMIVAANHRDADDSVKLIVLPSKYPQGAEKVLVYSATGRRIPSGKLPSDVGCIVMNITSIASLYRFIESGMPLVSKRITVDGTAVKSPKNILVPIGTYIRDVLDFIGEIDENAESIIAGGPMMGNSVSNLNNIIEKRTNALLIMNPVKEAKTTQCIHCQRCSSVCPMKLHPSLVDEAQRHGFTDRYEKLNVSYCMECGSCSYICPAKRPLTQVMRVAKAEMRRHKR